MATCSRSVLPGDATWNPPCCSHDVESQLAARTAGSAPLLTKPKYLGPAIATVAGDATRSSSSISASGEIGASCNATSNAASPASASSVGTTLRSASEAR